MIFNPYAMPLPLAVIIALSAMAVWTVLAVIFAKFKKDRIFMIISIIFLAISLVIIYYYGIYGRHPGDYKLYLDPFRIVELVKENKEMYRSLIMNVIMFLPFGMTFPFALTLKKTYQVVIITVITGFFLSVVVEGAQYVFSFGQSETIDVICNTAGAALGVIPYVICKAYKKKIS